MLAFGDSAVLVRGDLAVLAPGDILIALSPGGFTTPFPGNSTMVSTVNFNALAPGELTEISPRDFAVSHSPVSFFTSLSPVDFVSLLSPSSFTSLPSVGFIAMSASGLILPSSSTLSGLSPPPPPC